MPLPCHEIYRVEAVGLSISNHASKITIFVNTENFDILLVTALKVKIWTFKAVINKITKQNETKQNKTKQKTKQNKTFCTCVTRIIVINTAHRIRLYFIDLQLNTNSPSQFCVFYRKLT